MNDPIVSFDTLTIGAEIDALGAANAAQTPQVLARLPRVEPPRPKTINRIDEAESPIPMAHLAGATDELTDAPPAPVAGPGDDVFTTIRIDTVTPDRVAQPAPQAEPTVKPSPAPMTAAAPALRVVDVDEADHELNNWLLNLEAALLPYSRWIALGAVLAALGLTLVLLRAGGGAEPIDQAAPQVSIDADQAALADADAFAPAWPTPTANPVVAPADLDPQAASTPETTLAQSPRTATASGPASLPRTARRAVLTGEVHPIPAERVDVATARGVESYPRTNR